jgi:hypothetical protein
MERYDLRRTDMNINLHNVSGLIDFTLCVLMRLRCRACISMVLTIEGEFERLLVIATSTLFTMFYRVGSGELYGSDESWFDARTATRGASGSSEMTQFVLFPADCLQFTTLITTDHYPSNVLLITDGTCGSACSLFLSKFLEYGVGQVVSYGGFTDTGDVSSTNPELFKYFPNWGIFIDGY